MHLGALRREQVGDRVADRDPAAAAGVQRPGGVRRDELEVDAPAGERVGRGRSASPCATTVAQHVVQPGRREEEVEEARARRSRPARGARGGPGSSSSTMRAATSRGGMPTGLASWSATLVVKSPWSGSFGGVSSMPPGGAGKPAASSAAWSAARSWSRITTAEGWRRPAPFAARRARAW